MAEPKLNFIIGGAQKAGTSTLDAIFRLHPQIQMAATKETHFFDNEAHNWACADYSGLDVQFSDRDERLRGESTPITLYWRPAIRRLYEYNPNIKVVLLLRNPVARTFAGWRKEFSAGRETIAFRDAIRSGRERVRTQAETENLHRYFSYVERSLYGEQLSYLLGYFPRESVHCELSEEFFADRSAVLQRISTFIGIDPFPDNIPKVHLNAAREASYPSTLTAEDVGYLNELFGDDMRLVESILGRSLPSWKNVTLMSDENALY